MSGGSVQKRLSHHIQGMMRAKNQEPLDLAFFYADPLVAHVRDKGTVEYCVPLDLETEYRQIVDSLEGLNKRFSIAKEAMTTGTLADIISKQPTMLHISCHGSFDTVDGQRQFYLSIEDNKNNSCEQRLTVTKLRQLLEQAKAEKRSDGAGKRRQILLAFVSAC